MRSPNGHLQCCVSGRQDFSIEPIYAISNLRYFLFCRQTICPVAQAVLWTFPSLEPSLGLAQNNAFKLCDRRLHAAHCSNARTHVILALGVLTQGPCSGRYEFPVWVYGQGSIRRPPAMCVVRDQPDGTYTCLACRVLGTPIRECSHRQSLGMCRNRANHK